MQETTAADMDQIDQEKADHIRQLLAEHNEEAVAQHYGQAELNSEEYQEAEKELKARRGSESERMQKAMADDDRTDESQRAREEEQRREQQEAQQAQERQEAEAEQEEVTRAQNASGTAQNGTGEPQGQQEFSTAASSPQSSYQGPRDDRDQDDEQSDDKGRDPDYEARQERIRAVDARLDKDREQARTRNQSQDAGMSR